MTEDALTEFLLARVVEDEGDAQSLGGQLRGASWQGGAGTPARVLAECDAKRRIVEAYQADDCTAHKALFGGCGDDCQWKALEWTMKCLALPFADHPDWREEWRP